MTSSLLVNESATVKDLIELLAGTQKYLERACDHCSPETPEHARLHATMLQLNGAQTWLRRLLERSGGE